MSRLQGDGTSLVYKLTRLLMILAVPISAGRIVINSVTINAQVQ